MAEKILATFRIDSEVWQKFKAKCESEGQSASARLNDYILQSLDMQASRQSIHNIDNCIDARINAYIDSNLDSRIDAYIDNCIDAKLYKILQSRIDALDKNIAGGEGTPEASKPKLTIAEKRALLSKAKARDPELARYLGDRLIKNFNKISFEALEKVFPDWMCNQM